MKRTRSIAIFSILVAASGLFQVAVAQDRFECLVEPYLEVEISSGIPGILDEVLVDRGDFVRDGQVLARLRSDVQEASFELARSRAEFAARRMRRNEELYRKQMISSHEKDELETEAQLLELELREVEERLKLRIIKSPLNGVVVKRFYSPGEFVQDEAILELAQIDPLRVEVAIPVRHYGQIEVGMKADVEWEAPVLGSHKATVMVVDPVVDAASGTIGVRLELPNPKNQLPAGTKCWVRFPIPSGEAAAQR